MSTHFDRHIAIHSLEKLRMKLYNHKTIVRDQAKEIEKLRGEKEKLFKH